MSTMTLVPTTDPLAGITKTGRWSFVCEMPEELGGGHSCGELLLRADGVLMRRYGGAAQEGSGLSWNYGAWKQVPGWEGETDPERAGTILTARGYRLQKPGPGPVNQVSFGPVTAEPSAWGRTLRRLRLVRLLFIRQSLG